MEFIFLSQGLFPVLPIMFEPKKMMTHAMVDAFLFERRGGGVQKFAPQNSTYTRVKMVCMYVRA